MIKYVKINLRIVLEGLFSRIMLVYLLVIVSDSMKKKNGNDLFIIFALALILTIIFLFAILRSSTRLGRCFYQDKSPDTRLKFICLETFIPFLSLKYVINSMREDDDEELLTLPTEVKGLYQQRIEGKGFLKSIVLHFKDENIYIHNEQLSEDENNKRI